MGGSEGKSHLRVVKPEDRYMPLRAEQNEEKARLLSKVEDFYRSACDRLLVRESFVTRARLLDAGVCVGLLDPVSNVMANTLATTDIRPEQAEPLDGDKLQEMARRSASGLVAFLVYFFPYLPGWEAVRYLLLADADLLLATRLLAADRGMANFSLASPASAAAFISGLRLAAEMAKHPSPDKLVHFWMSLSSRLDQALSTISQVQPQSSRKDTHRLKDWLLGLRQFSASASASASASGKEAPPPPPPPMPDLGKSWDLAASRLITCSNVQYEHTRSLRMVLLDAIRGFYLRALARLPGNELRNRYHRSLLNAGHCYGPFDPVSNIILNTIWHDVAFPAAEHPVLDMIAPCSLTRIESRSFYGLVSFLRTRYHDLSEHQVVQCLVATCGNLRSADPKLDESAGRAEQWEQRTSHTNIPWFTAAVRKVEQQSPSTSVQEAYEAAATAAWHPNPEAQAVFLCSLKGMLDAPALSMLQSRKCLSSEDVNYIARLLAPNPLPPPEQIKRSSSYHVLAGKMRSQAQQIRICTRVKTVLERLLMLQEPTCELHIICGANELVCGPEYCSDKNDLLSFAPCKFRYSHVNFWVTRQDNSVRCSDLFFAEFDNEDEEGPPLSCCRVDVPIPLSEHARCLYCEAEGAKVVHPDSEKFHGCDGELEEVIRKERFLTNRIICSNEYAVQRLGGHEEDFIYVDVK